jgi:2-oxoisovalerate dehydrogenase E2 component (dihydrolipoyl transacylase)
MPRVVAVVMPRLGESVVEGTVTRWLKHEGQLIGIDEPLLEVTTDKMNTEIPAPCSGRITSILVADGTTVLVGTELAEIEVDDLVIGSTQPRIVDPSHISTDVPSTSAAPLLGVDRDAVGDVNDVRGASSSVPIPPALSLSRSSDGHSQSTGQGVAEGQDKDDVGATVYERSHASARSIDIGSVTGDLTDLENGDSRLQLTPMRRSIAEHMVRSTSTIPHGWTVRAMDVTSVVEYREKAKAEFIERYGVRLSYQLFVIQALCAALGRHPLLNSRWAGTEIVLKGSIHLGVAVAVSDGLVVPVIRKAHSLGFSELARALHDLVQRARAKRLTQTDMQEATFTLNNTGANGALLSYPIIPYGQCAILTTQAIVPTPAVRNGEIVIRHIMNVCLSFDHRIMDGATAGAFLQDLRDQLEGWTQASILI